MATIYLPDNYIDNCNVIYNGYIRSYTNDTFTEWVDIYIHQDYMEQFGSTSDPQPVVCDSLNTYSSNLYYKIGQHEEWFSMLTLAFLFVLILFEIRRFAKYDFA